MKRKGTSHPFAVLFVTVLVTGCGLQQTLEDLAIKEALATPVANLRLLEPVSGGTIKLTWNPHPSNKVVRYTLYRSFEPSSSSASAPSLGILRIRWLASSRTFQPMATPQKIADIAVPGNTYTDQVSQPGTYRYIIRAVVTTGEETVPSNPLAVCVDQSLNECGSSPPGGSSGGSTSGGSTSGGSTSGGSTSGGSTSGGSTSGGSTSGGSTSGGSTSGGSSSGGANILSVRFLDASGSPTDPIFLAAQDGSSSWFVPQRSSVGLYEFQISSPDGYYGIAVVCDSSDSLDIIFSSLAEVTHFTYTYCGGTPPFIPTVNLSGTISGNPFDSIVYAGIFARDQNVFVGPPDLSYTLSLPMNTLDLFAFGVSSSGAIRFYLERGLTLSYDTIRDIDFSLSDPRYSDGVTYPITVQSQNLSDTLNYQTVALMTEGQTFGFLPPVLDPITFQPLPFYASPNPLLSTGDKLTLLASFSSDFEEGRTYLEGLSGPQAIVRTLNLPSTPAPGPFSNVSRVGYLRFTVGIPSYATSSAGNPLFYTLDLSTDTAPTRLSLTLTPSRVGTVAVPNLSGVPGWNDAYGLDPSASTLYWEFNIFSSTLTLQSFLDLFSTSSDLFIFTPAFGTNRVLFSGRQGSTNLP